VFLQSHGVSKAYAAIEVGIEFVLHELSNDRHVCYPMDDLCEKAGSLMKSTQPG
jgi:hypothetical protein